MPVSKKQTQTWFRQETGTGINDPDCDDGPVTQEVGLGGRENGKSLIISPDLENERGSLDFPPNVRDPPDEIPSSIIRPKPGTRPESRDSPIIHARQQTTSGEGGVLANASRDARASGSRQAASGEHGLVGSRTKLNRDYRTILLGNQLYRTRILLVATRAKAFL